MRMASRGVCNWYIICKLQSYMPPSLNIRSLIPHPCAWNCLSHPFGLTYLYCIQVMIRGSRSFLLSVGLLTGCFRNTIWTVEAMYRFRFPPSAWLLYVSQSIRWKLLFVSHFNSDWTVLSSKPGYRSMFSLITVISVNSIYCLNFKPRTPNYARYILRL